ncbi:MAG: hypothetical protein COZ33_11335 [Nitrospirae bacterium CG_4_10_14_3_um_filter_70_108]|nr:MAG: hypothetical protein COZ33_11335 [Nitrospirae bacterium CG_4_10_14_3_um_filter_70_108]
MGEGGDLLRVAPGNHRQTRDGEGVKVVGEGGEEGVEGGDFVVIDDELVRGEGEADHTGQRAIPDPTALHRRPDRRVVHAIQAEGAHGPLELASQLQNGVGGRLGRGREVAVHGRRSAVRGATLCIGGASSIPNPAVG